VHFGEKFGKGLQQRVGKENGLSGKLMALHFMLPHGAQ
jgi:hypothetical protein